jgi:hypothetical protein
LSMNAGPKMLPVPPVCVRRWCVVTFDFTSSFG